MATVKILCVDDESLVLELVTSLCRELPEKPEVAGFTSPVRALEWLKANAADVALLDINMPEMDGIALAVRCRELRPETSIVFLTGYSEYAVDAIQLRASGYLLKPVNAEKLREEIAYAMNIRKLRMAPQTAHILARTFGEFDLFVDGAVVSFSRAKAKELLAFLIDRQGSSITRKTAFAALWGDAAYDRSMQKQLDVVIRSLRATLKSVGAEDVLEMKQGALRICPEKLDCDLYRFLGGDVNAINTYRGEYMNAYSWASTTEAFLDRMQRRL